MSGHDVRAGVAAPDPLKGVEGIHHEDAPCIGAPMELALDTGAAIPAATAVTAADSADFEKPLELLA